MKHCPTCNRSFPADAPPFCNDDGARLVSDSLASSPPLPSPPAAPPLASVSAPPPPPAQAPSAPAKKTTGRRVLIIIVAVIGIILGLIQIMRGLHLMSHKYPANSPRHEMEDPLMNAWVSKSCYLRVPKGWDEKDLGAGGTMFSAPKSGGISANLIVISEPFAGSLRQYADATLSSVKAASPGAQKVSDTAFATNSGGRGYKVGLRNKIKGIDLAQTIYFFDGKYGKKTTITTSAAAAQARELEPLFDQGVKAAVLY